jgi:hypothetical protein
MWLSASTRVCQSPRASVDAERQRTLANSFEAGVVYVNRRAGATTGA